MTEPIPSTCCVCGREGFYVCLGRQVLRDALVAGCAREWEARKTANMLRSARVCEAAEEACELVLENEQSGVLPSTGARAFPPAAALTLIRTRLCDCPVFCINGSLLNGHRCHHHLCLGCGCWRWMLL